MSDSSYQDDGGGNLKSIWDDPHVMKLPTKNGVQRQWKCLWCGLTFNQWNGTKAVYHLNQVKGYSIKPCSSHAIDDESKNRYKELMRLLEAKRKRISDKRVANMVQCDPSSDSSHDGSEESVVATTTNTTDLVKVGSVWEDDKIVKWTDEKGQKFWRCLWCNQRFSQWNATKTIHHLNRRKGCDIKPCCADDMDDEHKRRYASLMVALEAKRRKKNKKLQSNVEHEESDDCATAAPIAPQSTSITPSSSPLPHCGSADSDQYCEFIASSPKANKKRSRKDMESASTHPSSDSVLGRLTTINVHVPNSNSDESKIGDHQSQHVSSTGDETKKIVSPPTSKGPLNSIWDDAYVIRTRRPTGEKCWKCLWCDRVFSQHNATKAIYHVNQYRGNDIQPCTSKDIDDDRKKQYQGLMEALKNKRKKQKLQRKGKDIFSSFVEKIIEQHEEEMANKVVNFIEA